MKNQDTKNLVKLKSAGWEGTMGNGFKDSKSWPWKDLKQNEHELRMSLNRTHHLDETCSYQGVRDLDREVQECALEPGTGRGRRLAHVSRAVQYGT